VGGASSPTRLAHCMPNIFVTCDASLVQLNRLPLCASRRASGYNENAPRRVGGEKSAHVDLHPVHVRRNAPQHVHEVRTVVGTKCRGLEATGHPPTHWSGVLAYINSGVRSYHSLRVSL
jgi:hypothetical protein